MQNYLTFVSDRLPKRSILWQIVNELLIGLLYFILYPISFFVHLRNSTEGEKRPVILVSGFLGRPLHWFRMRSRLIAEGHPVYIAPNGFGVGSIPQKARALENFLVKRNLRDVYIVAHSMGGLVAADMSYRGRDRTRKIFMLGTPVKGTINAYLFPVFPCLWQMMPSSLFIREMNLKFPTMSNIRCIFARFEQTIVPNSNARLEGFDDVMIPQFGHANLFMGELGIECISELIADDGGLYELPAGTNARRSRSSGLGERMAMPEMMEAAAQATRPAGIVAGPAPVKKQKKSRPAKPAKTGRSGGAPKKAKSLKTAGKIKARSASGNKPVQKSPKSATTKRRK